MQIDTEETHLKGGPPGRNCYEGFDVILLDASLRTGAAFYHEITQDPLMGWYYDDEEIWYYARGTGTQPDGEYYGSTLMWVSGVEDGELVMEVVFARELGRYEWENISSLMDASASYLEREYDDHWNMTSDEIEYKFHRDFDNNGVLDFKTQGYASDDFYFWDEVGLVSGDCPGNYMAGYVLGRMGAPSSWVPQSIGAMLQMAWDVKYNWRHPQRLTRRMRAWPNNAIDQYWIRRGWLDGY